MVKGFGADRSDILLAMYGYFLTEDAGRFVSAFELKRRATLLLSTSYISLLLRNLEQSEILEGEIGDHNEDLYTLTKQGVLQAEKSVLDRGMTLDEFEVSFSRRLDSGLIVGTDSPFLVEARAKLDELQNHLRMDNDVGAINPDERAAAIEEVAQLQETLSKPNVRTSYLWSKANEVLLWITEKGAGAAVGEIAKSALQHIHSFINVFFN